MTSLLFAYGFALLGTFISLLNFHLSFTRPLAHRYLRSTPYKHVSGFPLFGSLLLWLSSPLFWSSGHPQLAVAAVAVSALDTGGLHWFFAIMFFQALRTKKA